MKKLISLVIAVAVSVSIFGCAEHKAPAPPATPAADKAAPAADAAAPAPAEPAPEEKK